MKELRWKNHKCNCPIAAPPVNCRTWRPLQPHINNVEGGGDGGDDDDPGQTLSGKLLLAEVMYHVTYRVILNLTHLRILMFLLCRW